MPLIEAEATPGTTFIKPGCWLREVDGERQVWLNWALFLTYLPGDAASQRFAAACLALAGVAPKTKIADAFGYHRNYVAKLVARLEGQGLEGMLEGKRGPRGPHKLHAYIRRRARELRRQGLSLQAIVRQLQQEWGISVTHTSVRRMVAGVEVRGNEGQVSLEGTWPLALPLRMVETTPSAVPKTTLPQQSVEAAPEEPPKVERATDVTPEAMELPQPVVKEGEEFSGAGGFLFYPALAALGLVEVFGKVYHKLASRCYGLREVVLALFFLWVMRFRSVEAFKGARRRDFGCLIGARRSPSVKTLRRKLEELVEQKQGHGLVMEMARRYAEGDIVELGVLYADGHMKPYYGSRSLGDVWSPQRRLPVPGLQQYFVNDREGRPLFFLTAQPQKTLTQILPKLVEHIRSVIGEQEFTLVFDRGGYSPKVFRVLRENKVHIITYRRKPFAPYPASVFSQKACQFKGKPQKFNLYDETVHLKGFGPLRNIAVLRDNGRQTHILTSDPKTEATLIACLMFNRWGQENFFKYMMEHYCLDALQGYGAEDVVEEVLVANPQRRALDDEIRKLRSEIKGTKEEIGGMMAKRASRAQLKSLRERLALMEEQLSALRKQRRQLPTKVPLSQTDKKLEGLDLEKKTVVDTIKMAAYNAEEWLLERLDRYYDDPRDIRQVLRILSGLRGHLWLRNDQLVVDLTPPEIPKYCRALLGLCAELNGLTTRFPGTPYLIRFAVAGTEVHTKPLHAATPMS